MNLKKFMVELLVYALFSMLMLLTLFATLLGDGNKGIFDL